MTTRITKSNAKSKKRRLIVATNGESTMARKLRDVLEAAQEDGGYTMTDLTVLSAQNDPYRVDTPAGHRDGQWMASQMVYALGGREQLHLRGIHYAIVSRGGVLKPNGQPYKNSDEDWTWLQNVAAKAGRWLGYVAFDEISDERNAPPIIHRRESVTASPHISSGIWVEIPDADDLRITVGATGFVGRQPYHIVIFGEKSSLSDALLPIARQFDADLYLPTGEISDTLMHHMARDGAQDGRPMRVFTLSDCDPAGHQMPVSIARKLQALRDLSFPDLEFEVRPIALTPTQVATLGLPSTPLKDTERRADRWRAAFGIEQTEIDALSTLQPRLFRRIVVEGIAPFFDDTLDRRVRVAETEWEEAAQAVVDEHTDPTFIDTIRAVAQDKLSALKSEIEALNTSLWQAVPDDLELPPIAIPEYEIDQSLHGLPLVSSDWDWIDQTRALKAHRDYEDEAS